MALQKSAWTIEFTSCAWRTVDFKPERNVREREVEKKHKVTGNQTTPHKYKIYFG